MTEQPQSPETGAEGTEPEWQPGEASGDSPPPVESAAESPAQSEGTTSEFPAASAESGSSGETAAATPETSATAPEPPAESWAASQPSAAGSASSGIVEPPPAAPVPPPASGSYTAPQVPSPASERPEVAVGAAFAGGFVLAMILKRLAR